MQLQHKIDRVSIGRRLRGERKRAGFTQESLSEAIGVTSKYLSKMENGAAAPSLPFVIKFCEVTGSDLNYLLLGRRIAVYEKGCGLGEEPGSYGWPGARLDGKDRIIFEKVMRSLAEALEEKNN